VIEIFEISGLLTPVWYFILVELKVKGWKFSVNGLRVVVMGERER